MKKIIIMLLLACSTITIANAQTKKVKSNNNTPTHVVQVLNEIINDYGDKSIQQYAVYKNPNTGLVDSKQRIVHFEKVLKEGEYWRPFATSIADAFMQDEAVSYQILHLAPGSNENFSVKITTDTNNMNNLRIRKYSNEDMWYMATKNTENPQLRDIYAIVFSSMNGYISGDIFMITSLRPDLYERDMAKAPKNTFRIDGRMGHDINDSLYVFYMADTYDELNKLTMRTESIDELNLLVIGDDPQFKDKIAYMFVEDHKFELNVEIPKRKVGRIRTVMPDGSLCKLWTNIDMVPGETYRITTHNGYYDEDRDFENRVGRYSGQSMIAGHDNDDVEVNGGYRNDVVEDTVVVWEKDDEELHEAAQTNDPLKNLTETQMFNMKLKAEVIEAKKELIEGMYHSIDEQDKRTIYTGGKHKYWENMDTYFISIAKENHQIDKLITDFMQTATQYGLSSKEIGKLYGEVIEFMTEQNQTLNDIYKKYGHLSDAATKCQKDLHKLTEKYLKIFARGLETKTKTKT